MKWTSQASGRRLLPAVLVAALIGCAVGVASAGHDDRDDDFHDRPRGATYAIGLWGDLPYSPLQSTVGLPNLIADMNAQRLLFTVHNGDLKAGSGSLCDDALYYQARDWFDALDGAAMFTPGQDGWVMSAWAAAVGAGALLLLPPRGWRSSAVLFALLGALAAALVLWPMIGPHRRFAAWSPALAESWPWFVALTVAPALIELALRRLGAGTLLVGIAVAAIGASALLAAGASARQGQFAAPVVAAVAGLLLLCRRLDARGLAGSAALVLGASLFAGHTYAEVAWLPALLVLAAPLLLLALCLLPWFASRPRWRLLTALLVVAVPVVAAVVIQRWPEPGSAGGSQIDYSHYYR